MAVLAAFLRGDTFLQCLLGQGIEAFALFLCSQSQLLVEIRRDPQIEFARELFAGFDTLFATNLQEHIQRSLELLSQLIRVSAIESAPQISLEFHHGRGLYPSHTQSSRCIHQPSSDSWRDSVFLKPFAD
jgi:hypothetical protein